MSWQRPSEKPFETADKGRGPGGRFALGNSGGPGNPAITEMSRHRAALRQAIRATDIALAIKTIRRVMRSGTAKDSDKLAAAFGLLTRILGTPAPAELLERLEQLEKAVAERNGHAEHQQPTRTA